MLNKININVANKPFKTVAKFKYLGMRVTNQNYIHKEIKNAYNNSVDNLLSYHLSENAEIEVFIILPVVLYGCEIWSLMKEKIQIKSV